ncbi:MAG: ArsR family transcriptional regulator, partial [Nanoarchaeota archaeon]
PVKHGEVVEYGEQKDETAKDKTAEIIIIRNEYESKLIQKDLEIRKRDSVINQIKQLLDVSSVNSQVSGNLQFNNLSMWLEKLGNTSGAKILRFLADKSPLKFTRNQICLATGISQGTLIYHLNILRRNNLIREEGNLIEISLV